MTMFICDRYNVRFSDTNFILHVMKFCKYYHSLTDLILEFHVPFLSSDL